MIEILTDLQNIKEFMGFGNFKGCEEGGKKDTKLQEIGQRECESERRALLRSSKNGTPAGKGKKSE
jgi:hypothetical protein